MRLVFGNGLSMQQFRASDGAQLAYRESGVGATTVVFVHGWQADNGVWSRLIDTLGRGVHVVAIDQRGSGESRSARGPYTLERHAADLRELIQALGIPKAVIVGHSMGATVALRLAVDAAPLVRGLVLIAPVPPSGGGYSEKGEAYLKATAGDPAAVRNWLSRTLAAPQQALLDELCAAATKTARATALESFESWAHANFEQATRQITVPALVIAPQQDLPEVAQRKVAALLPDSRFVVLPDSAHYAILEKPRENAELIKEFLAAVVPESGSSG